MHGGLGSFFFFFFKTQNGIKEQPATEFYLFNFLNARLFAGKLTGTRFSGKDTKGVSDQTRSKTPSNDLWLGGAGGERGVLKSQVEAESDVADRLSNHATFKNAVLKIKKKKFKKTPNQSNKKNPDISQKILPYDKYKDI